MKTIAILFWEGLKLFFILPFALTSKKVFEACWAKYYIQPMPKSVFNLCVQWLLFHGRRLRLSYEHMGNTWKCAEQALGVESEFESVDSVVIHMVGAKDGIVDAANYVVGAPVISLSEIKNHGIDHQDAAYEPWENLMLAGDSQH